MILSLNWLKDMVDLSGLSTEEIVNKITLSTAEVEGVTEKGKDISDVVIAKVLTCEKVPNTHLNLLSVDDGREVLQIATGAPNVYPGMITMLVRIDGMVAGHKIKKAKLAGIDSFGMCCSEAELGIGSDDEGIVDLKGVDYKLGTDIKELFPIEDSLIEIDNKSLTNRPDLWGHLGFARELASIFNRELKPIDLVDLSKLKGLPELSVDVKTNSCLRYSALRIENITKKVSPFVMKIRLLYCGLRDINLITDLTNYVMLELGQPMHGFDSAKVNGVIVREASKGEKLLTLEGDEHEIPEGAVVICDRTNEPVAIAGIKGGLKSGIAEDTTGLLLEGATFEASKIRKTSKAIGLVTDASLRYEKSLDPCMTDIAIARVVYLLKDIDNGIIISSSLADRVNYEREEKHILLNCDFVRNRIGLKLENEYIKRILLSLGFKVKEVDENNYDCLVPTYRATKDVSIREDLVEEIARMYGYDNIKPEPLNFDVLPVIQSKEHDAEYKIKELLSEKFDLNEVHSYLWNYQDFNESVGINSSSYVSLVDSTNSGQSGVRSEMTPTLLKIFSENKNEFDEIRIFEIGRVVVGLDENNLANEEKHLSILISSQTKSDKELYFELKKMLENIVSITNGVKISYLDSDCERLMPSARCNICCNGESLGVMGIMHYKVMQKVDKRSKVAVLELDFSKLMAQEDKVFVYKKVSKYPSVDIDFNFLVPTSVEYQKIEDHLSLFRCKFDVTHKIKDIYENKEVLKDNKSITIGFSICSQEHTLSAGEIESFRNRILQHMKQIGIELRA